jgi:activator of HSP90 ATPase
MLDETRPHHSPFILQFSLNPGSHFSLFNNNVTGSVLSVAAPSTLSQKWRAPQWPADHFGTLTTTLTEGESSTKLALVLEGVPLEEEQRSKDALDRFYIAGLKGLGLGTGSIV